MIDLSRKPRKQEPKDPEPEEVAVGVLAVLLWSVIGLMMMGVL